jgi:hypothetical protein
MKLARMASSIIGSCYTSVSYNETMRDEEFRTYDFACAAQKEAERNQSDEVHLLVLRGKDLLPLYPTLT